MGFHLDVVAGSDFETGYIGGGSAGGGDLRPVAGVDYAVAEGVTGYGLLAGGRLPGGTDRGRR